MLAKPPLLKAFAVAVLLLPGLLAAQSDSGAAPETPLGDIARALRKSKQKPPQQGSVIDNDNLPKAMEQLETQRLKGNVKFFFEGSGKDLQVSSPDVTCSLSFTGDSGSQSAESYFDLPTAEVAKLDGPAVINGDTLQVTVYNGTQWKIKEITVGLTILRPDNNSANLGGAKLVPAAATADPAGEKHPDVTVLYHLRGLATPSTSAVFRQSLGVTLNSDQEWHWAIVQARGIPPTSN